MELLSRIHVNACINPRGSMGKSQKTSNRFAVGDRIAVGVNGKAGDLGAAGPCVSIAYAQAKLAQASSPRKLPARETSQKPRRSAPGSFTAAFRRSPD